MTGEIKGIWYVLGIIGILAAMGLAIYTTFDVYAECRAENHSRMYCWHLISK